MAALHDTGSDHIKDIVRSGPKAAFPTIPMSSGVRLGSVLHR